MVSICGYVNIKIFEQKLDGNKKIEGKEIFVVFFFYFDVYKIFGVYYQIFFLEKVVYFIVYEEN